MDQSAIYKPLTAELKTVICIVSLPCIPFQSVDILITENKSSVLSILGLDMQI